MRRVSFAPKPPSIVCMNTKKLLLCLVAALSMGSQLQAQAPARAPTTQKMSYIKVVPGKDHDWMQLITDVTMKDAQVRADAGEIISWTILRSVYPAGLEARADYIISEISAGEPHAATSKMSENFQKAGVTMTKAEYDEKRHALASLVAAELWHPQIYNGSAQKGGYLTVNYMKVKDPEKYDVIESTIWSPLSQALIKDGRMTGWIYAVKGFPGGTDSTYGAYTADMYPTLESVFAARNFREDFAKVHPGKKLEDIMSDTEKSRELGRRELWVVVERVTKKP